MFIFSLSGWMILVNFLEFSSMKATYAVKSQNVSRNGHMLRIPAGTWVWSIHVVIIFRKLRVTECKLDIIVTSSHRTPIWTALQTQA